MYLEPWIAKNYHLGINNEKILILGESHYTTDIDPFDNSIEINDFTKKSLEDILNKKKFIKFFNYAGQLFNKDWTKIWENVAFAILIQSLLKEKEITLRIGNLR